jgi:hypothetical protein
MPLTQHLEHVVAPEAPVPMSAPVGATEFVPAARFNLLTSGPAGPATANNGMQGTSTRLWSATQPTHPAVQAPRAPTGGADGVVLHVTDDSVRCEFLHQQGETKVWLPRSLFPVDVLAGYTFELTLETQNGYRAPHIKPRAPKTDPTVAQRLAKLRAEFD